MLYFDELENSGLIDEVCECCKKHIISEYSGGNGWLCEGAFCSEAEEYYLENYKNGKIFCRKLKIKNLCQLN